jgi:hypothetical protein
MSSAERRTRDAHFDPRDYPSSHPSELTDVQWAGVRRVLADRWDEINAFVPEEHQIPAEGRRAVLNEVRYLFHTGYTSEELSEESEETVWEYFQGFNRSRTLMHVIEGLPSYAFPVPNWAETPPPTWEVAAAEPQLIDELPPPAYVPREHEPFVPPTPPASRNGVQRFFSAVGRRVTGLFRRDRGQRTSARSEQERGRAEREDYADVGPVGRAFAGQRPTRDRHREDESRAPLPSSSSRGQRNSGSLTVPAPASPGVDEALRARRRSAQLRRETEREQEHGADGQQFGTYPWDDGPGHDGGRGL